MVGSRVNLTVLEVQKNSVKIGIDAPEDIPVYRHEIYLRIRDENRKASSAMAQEITAIAGSLRASRPAQT